MGSKERLSCALTFPAGHEIDSEAVSSAIDSVPYLELWILRLAES